MYRFVSDTVKFKVFSARQGAVFRQGAMEFGSLWWSGKL